MRVIHYIREKWQLPIREKCLDLHSKRAILVSIIQRNRCRLSVGAPRVDFCFITYVKMEETAAGSG